MWLVQDIIGPYHTWPNFIKTCLESNTFNYRERVKICTFLYVNGIKNYMEIYNFLVRVKGMRFIYQYFTTIRDLLNYWNEDSEVGHQRRERYFSKCMFHNVYENLMVLKEM